MIWIQPKECNWKNIIYNAWDSIYCIHCLQYNKYNTMNLKHCIEFHDHNASSVFVHFWNLTFPSLYILHFIYNISFITIINLPTCNPWHLVLLHGFWVAGCSSGYARHSLLIMDILVRKISPFFWILEHALAQSHHHDHYSWDLMAKEETLFSYLTWLVQFCYFCITVPDCKLRLDKLIHS